MTDLNDAGIAEKLESYRLARGIERRSPAYRGLLVSYRHNPLVFAELLDRELARIQKMTNGGSPQ